MSDPNETTITDDQIRRLSRFALDRCLWHQGDIDIIEVCTIALGLPWPQPHPASGIVAITRDQARSFCAQVFEAWKLDAGLDADRVSVSSDETAGGKR